MSVIPFGSIAVILVLSCGFEAIFAAIGFNATEALFGVVVVDTDADLEGEVAPDFVPCVGVEVDVNVAPDVVP